MGRRHKIETDVQDLAGTVIRQTQRIADLEREIGVLQTKVSRIQLESHEARKVQVRATLARDVAAALRETREGFAAEVRANLEAGTAEMFKKLVLKDAHFDRVELSPEFQLSVVDKWGQPALGDLSAGETEVLEPVVHCHDGQGSGRGSRLRSSSCHRFTVRSAVQVAAGEHLQDAARHGGPTGPVRDRYGARGN